MPQTPRSQSRYIVDQALSRADIPVEQYEDFIEFCFPPNSSSSPPLVDIQSKLKEITSEFIPASAISRWRDSFKLPSAEATHLNAQVESYQGVRPSSVRQYLLGRTGKTLAELLDRFDSLGGAEAVVNQRDILQVMPGMLREFRAIANEHEYSVRLATHTELEMAGGYRLAAILKSVFDKTQFAQALEEGIATALDQLENEVRRSVPKD